MRRALLLCSFISLAPACATQPPMMGWPSERTPLASKPLAPDTMPFLPGEVLTYRATLAGICAGTCRIVIHPAGRDGEYLISYTARSSPIVDLFYKIRDRASVLTGALDFRPRELVLDRESDDRSTIHFDREERIAVLTREGTSGTRHFFLNTDDPRDPLSMVYYLRTLVAGSDRPLEMVTTTGRTPMLLHFTGTDEVTIGDARYKADRLVIDTLRRPVGCQQGEVVKAGELVIWRNQGNGRALLRGERQTSFGRLVIELVNCEMEESPTPVVAQSE